MPITAKLSKEFYDKFGHAVVDELVNWFNQVDATYRSELRDLNEVNFARLDAKLEQRAAQFEAKLEQRAGELGSEIAGLRADLQAGLARLEGGLVASLGMAEGRLARLTLLLWIATLGTLTALLKL